MIIFNQLSKITNSCDFLECFFSPDPLSNGRIKVNGNVVVSADVPLTRKQRRRIQRRLSAANKIEQITSGGFNDGNDYVWKRDEREWTPVTRGGSVDRMTPPALETVATLPNGRTFVTSPSSFFTFPKSIVTTSNIFGVLNNSVHDDPTPIKERALNYRQNNDHISSAKKLTFSPEIVDHVYIDSNHLAAPKSYLSTAHRTGSFKRSKSTSPTRSKNQAAKQRDIFKHFNPETANWIKH